MASMLLYFSMFTDPILLTQILLLFIVPVLLIKLRLISKQLRLVLLFIVAVVVTTLFFTSFDNPLTLLGISTTSTAQAFMPYVYYTLFGIVGILIAAKTTGKSLAHNITQDLHFTLLFIPISIAQEFIFHGFLLHKLLPIYQSVVIPIIATALIFGFMHIIYPRPLMSFALGTLAGLANVLMFIAFPNIIMSSFAHSILNWLAVAFTFFTFTEPDGSITPSSLKPPTRIFAKK